MNLFTLVKKILVQFILIFMSIFVVPHIFYFLFKNKEIFKYSNILILYHWSFGHQILIADFFSRYCLKKKKNLLQYKYVIPKELTNIYIYFIKITTKH